MSERLTVEQWAERGAQPELGQVFAAIAAAAREIADKIRYAGLDDAYGAVGATNVQGEQQQKLDVFANEVLIAGLRACPSVVGVVSEEDEAPVVFDAAAKGEAGQYVLSFDPLDGSSNIDVNVNVGTIFGVRAVGRGEDLRAAVCAPGRLQIAAGYVLYGPSVVFVASVGAGVSAFTLDAGGRFVQSAENMRMPEQGPYYSANEANAATWPGGYRDYLAGLLRGDLSPQRAGTPASAAIGPNPYSARYIGSLVADFHRTLLKGGVFLYPPTKKAPGGKLRLQYEANPLAMLAEAAGGMATNGTKSILDVQGTGIHERTALVTGSLREMQYLQGILREGNAR